MSAEARSILLYWNGFLKYHCAKSECRIRARIWADHSSRSYLDAKLNGAPRKGDDNERRRPPAISLIQFNAILRSDDVKCDKVPSDDEKQTGTTQLRAGRAIRCFTYVYFTGPHFYPNIRTHSLLLCCLVVSLPCCSAALPPCRPAALLL